MSRAAFVSLVSVFAAVAHAGDGLSAYIIEGSGFFGAPGIELTQVGRVSLSDPSVVEILPPAGMDLRFGGADLRPGAAQLVAFENITNSVRVLDPVAGGNTLVDSIGFMDTGVAGMAFSNDGSVAYITTTVGAFVRILTVDADTGAMIAMNNIITDSLSSLAVVPEGHPTLTPGDLYGLGLSGLGSLRLLRIDLSTNAVVSSSTVTGIGFSPQFETGLDFAQDGTLYALIQGFDEVAPDQFVEISSHLYTINPANGAANDLGVVGGDQTWDAVTLVIDEGPPPCPADLAAPMGVLNFFDIQAFITLFNAQDAGADLAAPFGTWNFFDIQAYITLFNQGCP